MFFGLLTMAALGYGPMGDLAGQVTIGPLSPVVKVGEPEPPIPLELLKQCKVVVLSKDGSKVIAKIDLKPKGFFRHKLAPGEYLVKAELSNAPKRMNEPTKVMIKEGQTTRLNLHADTGIR